MWQSKKFIVYSKLAMKTTDDFQHVIKIIQTLQKDKWVSS